MSHKGSWSRVKDQKAYHDNLSEILANSKNKNKSPEIEISIDKINNKAKTEQSPK